MVNNEWHIIGMCVSDFEKFASKKYMCYTLHVEVEKYGGNVATVEVRVFNTNQKIDCTRKMLGKTVAISGFVDTMKMDDGSLKMNLVASTLYEIAKGKINKEAKAETEACVVDDDLPF